MKKWLLNSLFLLSLRAMDFAPSLSALAFSEENSSRRKVMGERFLSSHRCVVPDSQSPI